MAIILGKKTYGRLETLQYTNDKFKWGKVVIGISCFYGFWAFLLAKLLKRKSIYYAIDFYSPKIAEDWIDSIFIWSAMMMDKFLCRFCDEVWDISDRINEGRFEYGKYYGASIIVPLSYPPSYFRFHQGNKKKVVFVGIEPYGLELIDVVWIKNKPLDLLLWELSYSGIGISLWKDKGNNYYGDPGKTKLYSACGLPVIMTDNTPYAQVINETQAGLIVPYDKKAVREAIREIQENYEFFKGNVPKTWKYINADVLRNIKILD